MELLDILKNSTITGYKQTKNYYFENHICNGRSSKVNLDYTLSYFKTDKILRFGICSKCRICFYHYDYES